MTTTLIRNAAVVVTMDAARREIQGGGLYIRDGWIEQVGPTDELPAEADTVVDLRGHVVAPGLVNTHHHLYQTLTRVVPGAQDAGLFDWLKTLYPIWARMTPEHVGVSTQVGLAELARSGCTTSSDHLYLFPNGSRLDDQIEAARSVGVRFHAARGSMSLGESAGGLPPDSVVESEDAILEDTQRVIEAFHDPEPGAMIRVVVAPCSPFSVTTDLMTSSAELARTFGVTLHTHLAETIDEEDFCLETFGLRPLDYAESVGWMGPDVWFAHGVWIDDEGVERMASSGTGVAHCPSSNMRLSSGVAPVRRYRDSNVRIGLGVDGSASNDGSHMLGEVRQAMLLARLAAAPAPGGRRVRRCPLARPWSWRRWEGLPCWGGMTSDPWNAARWRISSLSRSIAWSMPARCTIRSQRWCCAPPSPSTRRGSTACRWFAAAGSLPSTSTN